MLLKVIEISRVRWERLRVVTMQWWVEFGSVDFVEVSLEINYKINVYFLKGEGFKLWVNCFEQY